MTMMRRDAERTVAVVICAYTDDRWTDLQAAVASVHQQTRHPDELIVVIDHNEALYNRAATAFTNAQVVASTGPQGLSGARNTGITVATTDIVAFLDDDARAAPTWLESLLPVYIDASIIGAGGAIHPDWDLKPPTWLPEEYLWVIGCTYRGLPEHQAPVRNLIGCNMSFRREAILAVGGFNSAIGQVGISLMRHDDTEFCIRLGQAFPSSIILYEPSAIVSHRVPATRAHARYFFRRCYTEGVSKALMTREVGRSQGLASERAYVTKTLPIGALRSMKETARGDASGLGRLVMLLAGFIATSLGYGLTVLTNRRSPC